MDIFASKKVAVVVPIFSEEQKILGTLKSLNNQHLKPKTIVVINLISEKIFQTAHKMGAIVVDIRKKRIKKYTIFSTSPLLAFVINQGIKKVAEISKSWDYILILNAGSIVDPSFIEILVKRAEQTKSVMNIVYFDKTIFPILDSWKFGYLINFKFWKKIGLKFPLNFGWAGYLILKAISMGYHVTFSSYDRNFYPPTTHIDILEAYGYGISMALLRYPLLLGMINSLLVSRYNKRQAIETFLSFIINRRGRKYVLRTNKLKSLFQNLLKRQISALESQIFNFLKVSLIKLKIVK